MTISVPLLGLPAPTCSLRIKSDEHITLRCLQLTATSGFIVLVLKPHVELHPCLQSYATEWNENS